MKMLLQNAGPRSRGLAALGVIGVLVLFPPRLVGQTTALAGPGLAPAVRAAPPPPTVARASPPPTGGRAPPARAPRATGACPASGGAPPPLAGGAAWASFWVVGPFRTAGAGPCPASAVV